MNQIQNWLQNSLLFSLILLTSTPAYSQINPDNTLGAESSLLIQNIPINGVNYDFIDGGAQRGANLFHSFSQFNINDGQRVYFLNPSGVGNILTRVTGGSASNILGTMGVLGNANLFLINPNGIVFGQNARLDVRGSFVATTANGVRFGEQGLFSATNPEAAPLLNVNPSALFFNQLNQGKITVQSKANAGISPTGAIATGLRVSNGESLQLVGGDINIDGGELKAFGGNIELAGLSAPGDVGLNFADNNLSLTMPDGVERADVFFTNGAVANVRSDNGGNIKINARNVELAGESKLRAGIDIGLGTPESQGGDVVINATGATTLKEGSFIANILLEEAFGKTGDIKINTGYLNFDNGQLNVTNYGQGSGGNIFLQVKDDIYLNNASAIFSGLEIDAVSNSVGNIQIEAGSLSLASSEINSKTYGQGNAGNISIKVREAIKLQGRGANDFSTRIISAVNYEGVGKAGDIQITTGSLELQDGAFISSLTLGTGDAGNITIDAQDNITFENGSYARGGTSLEAVGNGGEIRITTGNLSLSGGSQIENNIAGQGNSSDITINARESIKLDGIVGTFITGINSQALSANAGKGGNIQITTGSLSLTNGATVNTSTGGQGTSGNITINAQDIVTIDGFGEVPGIDCSGLLLCRTKVSETGQITQQALLPSIIGSSTLSETANSGNIRINTNNLFLKDGGRINADAISSNDGGDIFIQAADTVTISSPEFSVFSSQIGSGFLGSNLESTGNGGNINIQTGKFILNNSALLTSTLAKGNAGNISINVQDSATLINSRIFSNLESSAVGNGGNIDFKATKIFLDNSRLYSPTRGIGNAGNIFVQATNSLNLTNESTIFSSITNGAFGNSGDINILAGALSLDKNSTIIAANLDGTGLAGKIAINTINNIDAGESFITTFTDGKGDAGKINLQAGGDISITSASGILANVGESGVGNGGDITIQARNFYLNEEAQLQTRTLGKGNAGNITINTTENLNIDKSIVATTTNGQGDAGKISLQAGDNISILGNLNNPDISLGSSLFSGVEANGVGKGGDIEIQARNFFADGAKLFASTIGQGNSGKVQITTIDNITFKNGAQIITSTIGQGDAGNVKVTAGGQVLLDGVDANGLGSGIQTTVGEENYFFGTGKGGNVEITAPNLFVTNNAQISSSSFAEGNAGDIFINSGLVQLDNKGKIAAVTNSKDGGNINFNITDLLLLRRNSNISTTAGLAQAGGDGGNITINSPFIVAVPNEDSDISANAFTGKGGNININAEAIFGIEPRPKLTNQSDITASSELGVQGQITITQPQVQPPQKLLELPTAVVDASTQIAQTCPRGPNAKPLGKFAVTGRGSLPPTSLEPLTGATNFSPLASLDGENAVTKVEAGTRGHKHVGNSSQIIEAQGLVKTADGDIMLVAQAPNSTPAATSSYAMCPES